MKRYLYWTFFLLGVGILTWFWRGEQFSLMFDPRGENTLVQEKPYDKYSFERLVERKDIPSEIEIGRELPGGESYKSYVFYYHSEGRRISGQINIPFDSFNIAQGLRPVVVMARGYVDKEGYLTGDGTRNSARVYAENGYLTLAPDFSGYGESEAEDLNALGARLLKPVEILDLLASLESLAQANPDQIYLWGHSNGGQIILSVAEILGRREQMNKNMEYRVRAMSLWAPVSKPFPYNILYYTDESDDRGKWLRSEIAKFEAEYDVFEYSIDRYLDWIRMPLLIHQGSLDEPVPKKWSDELSANLDKLEIDHTYYVYPGADHNMRPSWSNVVNRDLEFFAGN